MLRSEHVMARLYRGRLVPHRLSPEDERVLDVATELCGHRISSSFPRIFRLHFPICLRECSVMPDVPSGERTAVSLLRYLTAQKFLMKTAALIW